MEPDQRRTAPLVFKHTSRRALWWAVSSLYGHTEINCLLLGEMRTTRGVGPTVPAALLLQINCEKQRAEPEWRGWSLRCVESGYLAKQVLERCGIAKRPHEGTPGIVSRIERCVDVPPARDRAGAKKYASVRRWENRRQRKRRWGKRSSRSGDLL